MSFIASLRRDLVNLPGWRTRRKILVIESDDWGSIRTSSRDALEAMRRAGIPVEMNYFVKNDALESPEDMELLFGLLSSFSDVHGNHPVITANAVLANPDFDSIRKGDFIEYKYERIADTYLRYFGDSTIMNLWKQGMDQQLIRPQFHGREHVNVWEWMEVLRSGNTQEMIAFDNRCILGLGNKAASQRPDEYMAAFSFESNEEKSHHSQIISEGLDLFEKTFGFRSASFIAPCGVHPFHLDEILYAAGVKYIQGGRQYELNKEGQLTPVNRFWGYKNSNGQIFWRRNATFEPSRNPQFDWVGSVMSEIRSAFRWGKPAVINSHRVNYSGSINAPNRDNSLKLMKKLLEKLLHEYPEVEFLSSDRLGDLISGK